MLLAQVLCERNVTNINARCVFSNGIEMPQLQIRRYRAAWLLIIAAAEGLRCEIIFIELKVAGKAFEAFA